MSALDLLLVIPRRENVMDSLLTFQRNSGAYDMVAKILYYSLQLVPMAAPPALVRKQRIQVITTVCNGLVKSLLNLRMLINQQRYPYTVRLLFRALEGNASNLPIPVYIISVIMFALRVVEQTTGDFMYWHLWFPNLHRYASGAALNFRYKFCKCWANVCTVFVETYKLYKSRNEERRLRHEYRTPLTYPYGGVILVEREQEKQERLEGIVKTLCKVRSEREGSQVSLACAFLEIWVYLRWAEWYKPPAFIPPLCGALSSCIGTYYLWRRTTEMPPEELEKQEKERKLRQLCMKDRAESSNLYEEVEENKNSLHPDAVINDSIASPSVVLPSSPEKSSYFSPDGHRSEDDQKAL